MKPRALVRGFACGCLLVVLVGLKGLLVVLSFGFLQVSLARFSLFFLFYFVLFFFFFLVIILYTYCILRDALHFLKNFVDYLLKKKILRVQNNSPRWRLLKMWLILHVGAEENNIEHGILEVRKCKRLLEKGLLKSRGNGVAQQPGRAP
jgi:hypothetical protein